MKVILVFGEDAGLVRERALTATKSIVGSHNDPFRVSILTREEHSHIVETVAAPSLGAGRRVIRVLDAGDSVCAQVERAAPDQNDALILLEAGALSPKSKLRIIGEAAADWAVIACYPERQEAVAAQIVQAFRDIGADIERPALAYLTTELNGETTRRRVELEKLTMFTGSGGTLTLADAHTCCSSVLEATLSTAVMAALLRQADACDTLLEELQREGATGPAILSTLSGQVCRLLLARSQLDAGRPIDAVLSGLRPPLYRSQASVFRTVLERWPVGPLQMLSAAIRDADIACKRAGSMDFTIAAQLLAATAGRYDSPAYIPSFATR